MKEELLTERMIRQLSDEAARFSDLLMVQTCQLALEGEIGALEACCEAINNARAMDNHFVRVVFES